MLHAQLHGKLSSEQENKEDLLTSNVFGTLKLLPPDGALCAFLNRAVMLDDTPLDLPASHTARYLFWPSWAETGSKPCEPDLVVELGHTGGTRTLVLIEVKYRSGKSSEADEGDLANDQLAREWSNLKRVAARAKATPVLVYLTMDCTIPRKSLESAQRELRQTKDGAGALFWLSWHHLPAVLRKASPTDEAQQTLLSDLRALISRRYGFGFFEGFGRVDVCESDWQFHGKPASDAPRPAIFDWQRQVRQSAWAFGEER